MKGDDNMKRYIAAALAAVITVMSMPVPTETGISAETLIKEKFDFGGLGTAGGYTGVSASDGYSVSKGYGFSDTSKVENMSFMFSECYSLTSVNLPKIESDSLTDISEMFFFALV